MSIPGSLKGPHGQSRRALGARPRRLASPAFRPLPLGSVSPEGWLRRQLRLQADGLSGHLDEFWPDIADSQWFGGRAEGWERAPYWLDGVVPLAWVLDDQVLKEKVRGRIEQILQGQRADGWFAPYPLDPASKPYDLWAMFLATKMLAQYHEATGDSRTLQAMLGNLKAVLGSLERVPLFGWGKYRWFEGLIPAFYAYEHTGEPWLLELARVLREQGFDYLSYYGEEEVTVPTPRRGLWTWAKHVVNSAMTPKAYALSWRLSEREEERSFAARMIEILDRHHGQVTGMFTGDECLAGKNPIQGTELCAVVEFMYSLEQLVSLTGDPAFADRLERVAFNALPAAIAPDMWSHQYDQQANQVQCSVNADQLWTTNGPDSNIFGLEPNYGCCTANMHQGWPKLAANLWMRTQDDGIAAMVYAPSTARFDVRGAPVRVTTQTDYPFRETLRITVSPEKAVRFPLLLRVPSWAEGASVRVAGGDLKRMKHGSFHAIDREWRGSVEVNVRFPMKVRTSRRYHGALAIERGPLVFSLKVGEAWNRINADKAHRELPHGDFEVRPTAPWNYGLLANEVRPEQSISFEELPVGDRPFSPEGAGVVARVKGRRLPGWKLVNGWAAEIPVEPQESSESVEELTLIPYGCTNIRITEFPRLV